MPVQDPPLGAPARADAAPAADRARERLLDAVALAMVAAVFALPLRGLLRAQGPPMEEGFMLVFPELVLEGKVPNVDFLHLYGPGSLWALAAVYKVFGVSLLTERLFGLAQQMAVVFGIFLLARPWGRRLAVSCALVSALCIVPFGLTALAWVGAVGLALVGLAAVCAGRSVPDGRAARRRVLLGGVALGAALTFRLDLVVAVGLATVASLPGLAPRERNRLLGGIALGVSPYLVHVAMAGPRNVVEGMVLDPVFRLRGGRSLPVPPNWTSPDGFLERAGALEQLAWPLPEPSTAKQLFLGFFLLLGVVALSLVVAVRAVRSEPSSHRARVLLVVSLFGAGLLPQALQRVDSAHFQWVGCVPIGFLPVVLFEIARRRAPGVARGRLALASGAAVLALMVFVVPNFTVRRYADYSAQTFGYHRTAHRIEHEGRIFYYGKADRAQAAARVVAATARITRPGDRLFVGPVDLRRTPYSDAYLYHLLGDLEPATYYIEMDPGVANAPGSGLAEDLASADVAILSAIWEDWDEPNDSREVGSSEAAEVLARDFCLVDTFGDLYQLWRRCA
ncbi:MAG: hypothetical protein KatS3mg009_2038 [Acidimicrobiia bacterium]|nr:MAG: hypothetical protein KatS3mg009_2038 [Acidimicrobiia bacterium]